MVLSKMIGSSGYKEKAPDHVQEDDSAKLSKLLQELNIIEEAENKLGFFH